ncbi:MAPK/MAK/MRK overlapping kinase isoform X2 [Canis lupus familiaris]|uniref:MAPK/MAK/MRK overlapping kinase isoform X2 n=1 Tax=Canis lupus dingo TaxID=286419 RepID=UPI000DC6A78C|nr:MAPK/MAK/MRK overlapping kinase isoform X2 [Canis lupus dingo]XP_038401708.1 MAPK/MAK/MRK overlapping kinase isoform X2 [Canis lupus familiaris]
MKNYKAIGKIGEGTFSEVMKMQSLRDGSYYACKQMKQHFESIEQVNNLREIQALRRLNPHPNILTLHEVVFDRKSGSLALICELMDMNIYELIQGRRHPLSEKKITHYMYQLCKSLDHMHRNGIFHRDVKPENILIKQDVLKLGDFGSCRSIYSKQPYTEYISTRWYRAPECLLTDGFYTYKMDLWSAGCVFYEITSLQPLFPGANELDQISKIHDVIGTPAEKTLTKFKQSRAMSFDFPFKKGSGIPLLTASWSSQCLSLLHAMVAYDPDERITAHQALQHPYFHEQRAAEKQAVASHRKAFFPERPVAPELLRNGWQISKEDRKQKQSLRPGEDHPKRPGPACPTELPRLTLSGVTKLSSYSSPALPSAWGPGAHRKAPALRPLKCVGANQKTDAQKDIKPKQYHLPTIERKGGGY